MDESARKDEKAGPTWIPEIDQLLIVGLKNGRTGTREAIKKVRKLMPELPPGKIWSRLRYLRDQRALLDTGTQCKPEQWPKHLLEILKEGYQYGGARKREALNIFRNAIPGVPRQTVARFAREQGWTSQLSGRAPRWTNEEEEVLARITGERQLQNFTKELDNRTPKAIQVHLNELGLSARQKDGLSAKAFQEMLHIGPPRFRRWVTLGILRVADPRITTKSIEKVHSQRSGRSEKANDIQISDLLPTRKVNRWDTTATMLGCTVQEVLQLVVRGSLKMANCFVTDKALREFCGQCNKSNDEVLNVDRINPNDLEWLSSEYKLDVNHARRRTKRDHRAKHALTVRTCRYCKKPFNGNVYFSHIKGCKNSQEA